MPDAYTRMEILLGRAGVNRLSAAKIAVFGLGGVGSCVVEALARCGVGCLTLVDHGSVFITNINRQLFALRSTLGKSKVQAAKERVRDIDEDILVHTYETFYNKETESMFDLSSFDYVVDAMDTVASKLLLIEKAKACGTPVISCMETVNKLDPSKFEITDISKTMVCPMAREMRLELRKRGIKKVKVLYSRERLPRGAAEKEKEDGSGRPGGGSISFVSGTAGFLIAGEVVRELLAENTKGKKAEGALKRI